MMAVCEKDLDEALAAALENSAPFRGWFLGRLGLDKDAKPVSVRSNHPWYKSPSTGRESETDVLAVFKPAQGARFAVHVEHKMPDGEFSSPHQAEDYRIRAKERRKEWGNYDDFRCVIIAPDSFLKKEAEVCDAHFDCRISFEEIAEQLPIYSQVY